MNPDRKGWNSSLRPVAKNKIGKPKKPPVRRKPSLEEVQKWFKVVTAAMLGEKPRKPMKKRAANNEGWIDVARAIWDDPANEHKCEVCDAPLGDVFNRIFYHHLLHRGTYRKMKRRPENLAQVCPDHHQAAHDYGVENLAEEGVEHRRGWMLLATRLVALRNEANNITDGNERMG